MKRKVLSLSLFLMLFFGTFWLQAQEYVQQTDLPTIYRDGRRQTYCEQRRLCRCRVALCGQ